MTDQCHEGGGAHLTERGTHSHHPTSLPLPTHECGQDGLHDAAPQEPGLLQEQLTGGGNRTVARPARNLKVRAGLCVVITMLVMIHVASVSHAAGSVPFHCNGQVGLVSPLPLCSQSIEPITGCTRLPGAEVVEIPGINHISRPLCRISPPTSAARSLPMVLFFHGALGSADTVLDKVPDLVAAARSWSWPGTRPDEGFVLAVPSGSCLSWPRNGSKDGYHWDFYHRNLSSPSSNPDVALADAIIDAEVASGRVDPSRIFVMGWSNGGFFGQMYAAARSAGRRTPTPGGSFVAAASVYTAADPFNNLNFGTRPSCQLVPYPRATGAKLMITSNDCDLVACDAEQAKELEAKSRLDAFTPAPGFDVNQWVNIASSAIGTRVPVRWDLVDASDQGRISSGCSHGRACTPVRALSAHSKWPAGRLAEMLTFLGS
jgi:poly(3-hydroxybutyrate) depolymerase